jgi:hypothetical protein
VSTINDLRVLITTPDGSRHPLFVSFLQRKSWPTCEAENYWQKDETVEGPRNYEGEPHPEVIRLHAPELVLAASHVKKIIFTSRSFERVRANTLIPISFVNVIPERT